MSSNYECIHEEQIIGQSRAIERLKTRSEYKEKMIDELNVKMENMDNKIDKVDKKLDKILIQSKSDDNELDRRLTRIETRLATQEKLTKEYQEENNKRINVRLVIVGLFLTALTIIIPLIFKGG